MFFPDKPRAFSEARRVLKTGGLFLFNVWDRIGDNELADAVTMALASTFPEALIRRFGAGTVDGKIQAHIVAIDK